MHAVEIRLRANGLRFVPAAWHGAMQREKTWLRPRAQCLWLSHVMGEEVSVRLPRRLEKHHVQRHWDRRPSHASGTGGQLHTWCCCRLCTTQAVWQCRAHLVTSAQVRLRVQTGWQATLGGRRGRRRTQTLWGTKRDGIAAGTRGRRGRGWRVWERVVRTQCEDDGGIPVQ